MNWMTLDEFIKLKPRLQKAVTVYMVSSSINERDVKKAKAYDAVADYLIKPIRLQELNRIFT